MRGGNRRRGEGERTGDEREEEKGGERRGEIKLTNHGSTTLSFAKQKFSPLNTNFPIPFLPSLLLPPLLSPLCEFDFI